MRERKYIYIFMSIIVLIIGFHFVTWTFITSSFFTDKGITVGDLGRLSYLSKSVTLRKDLQNLPLKHVLYSENVEIDVLTLGDSFSDGNAGGINSYYQDHLSTIQNLKVMNIRHPSKEGFIETILILNSYGILDKLKPKAIILQSIERSAIDRYAKNIDWDIGSKKSSISFLDNNFLNPKPKPLFINNLNYNAFLYRLLYNFDDNAFFSKTYVAKLTKNMFSCEDKDKLLFYYGDLEYIPKSNTNSISLLNNNLNKLQTILNEKNITLYFMPAVDKYNLYSKYIKDNNYPKSNFFEMLRPLKKEYEFIDTKMILEDMLDNNISDVYFSDDTHWSNKASKEIFSKTRF